MRVGVDGCFLVLTINIVFAAIMESYLELRIVCIISIASDKRESSKHFLSRNFSNNNVLTLCIKS